MDCHAFRRTCGLETVVLWYFNVFGPRQASDSPSFAVIRIFVTRLPSGQRPIVHGTGGQSRDFTSVENVVQGKLLAAGAAGVAGRTFNLAHGRSATLLRLLAFRNELLGTTVGPEFADPRPGDVHHSQADIAAARSTLGYTPEVTFAEGRRRSIEYYRSSLSV
jgi:UDP-glucose 4-epimerase